jgi:hypothetical protein
MSFIAHGTGIPSPRSLRRYRIVRFSPRYAAYAVRLRARGASTTRIASHLGIAWATAAQLLTDRRPLGVTHQSSLDRRQWNRLVSANPGIGAKRLRKLSPALYARLYRSSREWLLRATPRGQHSARNVRVDWVARDIALARRVIEQAVVIRSREPLTRITANRIGRETTSTSLLDKYLHRLPLTRTALAESCESVEQFQLRRLRQVVRRIEGTGKPMPEWRLLRLAGLRREVMRPSVCFEVAKWGRSQ